ncbi:hypothetical protein IX317_000630 [Fusobacterium sp. DD29]|uniref:N-6 DNA methylase n=1 Tax=unclassified Fusobacterium TaxID=2648384 RepID=UPI001B8D502A|nr:MULTISPECIES: N-6 DNA methylase [unclassified Fusobacterium]MBR8700248.1 hypothetical protein [Fusobacterium sp. DD45]MBR8710497.1 hypothetical protein [Fusobacterium sp. DD28]MBR8748969.1 hypothetical protein [Fusobacterium sp. DD29]MBR8751053.1 hypothetical protein [Fusobacterium sp. DD26]MBR8761275.1 hypothetical protein [Fusobacterium sp. DD25]
MTSEKVNEILGIKDSYKMPDTLLSKLLSEEKETLLNKFMELGEPLDHDWFTEYYQSEHSDRDRLKQDFTPDCVCEIVSRLTDQQGLTGDICAGTGGLTLKQWQKGADNFYCLEYSGRAIPILLFNMCIRNTNAIIIHGDALTREVFNCYKLTKTDKYSDIEVLTEVPEMKMDTIISNPPYSLKWDAAKERQEENRFKDYGLAPKSKADYAFLLDSLDRLEETGTLVAILPHGVLFRGGTEEKIRTRLIQNNLIDTIIGLPDKLFLNTGIPVLIMILKKNRTRKDILFVDCSKDYEKDGATNFMTDIHINRLIESVEQRKFIDKYAAVCLINEVERNDYNLNIPRYVDTFEPEVLPYTLEEAIEGLAVLDKEILDTEIELVNMMKDLTAGTVEKRREIETVTNQMEELVENGKDKLEQMQLEINT